MDTKHSGMFAMQTKWCKFFSHDNKDNWMAHFITNNVDIQI